MAVHSAAERQDGAESFGGWPAVAGIVVTAGLVALPTGLPLSEVLGRWVPSLHGAPLALPVTGAVWAAMTAWLLQGVFAHVGYTRRTATAGSANAPVAAPSPARRRAAMRAALPIAGSH
jgi:hypothetical protein